MIGSISIFLTVIRLNSFMLPIIGQNLNFHWPKQILLCDWFKLSLLTCDWWKYALEDFVWFHKICHSIDNQKVSQCKSEQNIIN